MSAAELRAQFPVLAGGTAFLNAGTCGPLPGAAARAQAQAAEMAAATGRATAYFERLLERRAELRRRYSALLGADPAQVALTTSTSEGVGRVVAGLELGPGDEILVADLDHPGVLGPVAAARDQRGASVRSVPLDRIADAVSPATRLIACSHVHWMTGAVAPAGLGALGDDVLVLLDGAQGVGAVPVDVGALGCDFYAGSGQKWLCGPIGLGMLWISPRVLDRVRAPAPSYLNLVDPDRALDVAVHPDARRHDLGSLDLALIDCALASLDVLGGFGWEALHARAAALAHSLADGLAAQGREVIPRDDTSLVAWRSDGEESEAVRDRLVAAGIVVRNLPGTDHLRASVGAWNDESDIERLLAAL